MHCAKVCVCVCFRAKDPLGHHQIFLLLFFFMPCSLFEKKKRIFRNIHTPDLVLLVYTMLLHFINFPDEGWNSDSFVVYRHGYHKITNPRFRTQCSCDNKRATTLQQHYNYNNNDDDDDVASQIFLWTFSRPTFFYQKKKRRFILLTAQQLQYRYWKLLIRTNWTTHIYYRTSTNVLPRK